MSRLDCCYQYVLLLQLQYVVNAKMTLTQPLMQHTANWRYMRLLPCQIVQGEGVITPSCSKRLAAQHGLFNQPKVLHTRYMHVHACMWPLHRDVCKYARCLTRAVIIGYNYLTGLVTDRSPKISQLHITQPAHQ